MSKEATTQSIAEINRIFKAGNATEHSYRPALKSLLENMVGVKNYSPLHDGGKDENVFDIQQGMS